MKVLQVASSLFEWGGIERYVHYLDIGLTDRGHQVVVACPPGSPLASRASIPECLVANHLKYSLRTYARFRRIGSSLKPDVVHVHFSPDFLMPALALRQTTQAKIVMTRHLVLPWSPAKVRRYTSIYDRIIPVSNAVEEKLANSGVPKSMMTVAKAGVPDAPEAIRTARSDGQLRVGFFGRLVREKGVDVLLKAVKGTPNATAEIFGDGPARTELGNIARELGISDRSTFHGYVSDVHLAMADVDVVAVPSLWDEAFPYTILEAMAAGKPIVASRVGGIPEVVEDGVTGRLFERGEASGFANVLAELGGDRANLAKMGDRGREVQRSEYTIPKMAERIDSVYRIALGQS